MIFSSTSTSPDEKTVDFGNLIKNRNSLLSKDSNPSKDSLKSEDSEQLNDQIQSKSVKRLQNKIIPVWPPVPNIEEEFTGSELENSTLSNNNESSSFESRSPKNSIAKPRLCPKCQYPLLDPDGMGICSQCGYCHSLSLLGDLPKGSKGRLYLENLFLLLNESLRKIPDWLFTNLIVCVLLMTS